MKLKNILICVLTISLLVACKSKKKAARKAKMHQNEIIAIKKNTKSEVKPRNSTLAYIEQYKAVAMDEMKVFKIPASITLAQGILESSSGNSLLTKKSNNHFGIKCHKGWKGKRVYHDDDEKGECFRVYKDPKTSFRDHSMFLVGRERYSKLFKFKKEDYVKWAKGLREAGYATDKRYPDKLIGIIKKYELYKYDAKVLGRSYRKLKTDK